MKRDAVVAVLNAHLGEFRSLGVAELSLFGSVARDEAGPESDLDALARFSTGPTWRGYMELKQQLERLLGVPVDPRNAGHDPP
jgi:uncharacterized protein